jgi:hypothetical protein
VDDAMKGYAGHNVDEETKAVMLVEAYFKGWNNIPGHFIQGMKDERISPHSNSYGIVSERQAVRADEQPLRARENPDGEHAEEIYEVA